MQNEIDVPVETKVIGLHVPDWLFLKTVRQRMLADDEVEDEARSVGETQSSGERDGGTSGGRLFFERAVVHRGASMMYSCTVRAQCARITECSDSDDFRRPFAIRKKLVDVRGLQPLTPCLQRMDARRINTLRAERYQTLPRASARYRVNCFNRLR